MSEIADILKQIAARRRARVAESSRSGSISPHVEGQATGLQSPGNAFVEALESAPGRSVIAEVKLGSPRLGSLAETVDPEAQARIYAASGAACISVVVEPDFFFGSYELLTRCREASGLPALAKDFVVHSRQLEWASRAGADAVLLIAALLSADELRELSGVARSLGLVPMVECHTAAELGMLSGHEWEMVGINNRDLRTFEVSLEQSIAMLPSMPPESLRIAESGIKTGDDIARLESAGFEAFLVGESLLLAADPAAKLHELVGSKGAG